MGRQLLCDLSDARRTVSVIREYLPDVVVHAQALSDVERCERNPHLAQAMNVTALSHVVQALEGLPTLLIALSSDYVFDGSKLAPYEEADEPHPISVYGRTKWQGEQVTLSRSQSLIVRTSTLFGLGRVNFCDHIVTQLANGKTLDAFDDQVTSPTYTEDLASAIQALIEVLSTCELSGLSSRIIHIANAGACRRLDFAYQIADELACSRTQIRAVSMVHSGLVAQRPRYSALATTYIAHLIGRGLRPWQDALKEYLSQRH